MYQQVYVHHVVDRKCVLRLVALRAACELLVAKPFFNSATKLLNSVVPYMDANEVSARRVATDTIINVLAGDPSLSLALEASRAVTHYIESRGFDVHADVLRPFMSMHVRDKPKPKPEETKPKEMDDRKDKRQVAFERKANKEKVRQRCEYCIIML